MRGEDFDSVSSIKTALSVISLAVPLLYLIGYFYDLGYLTIFNVSNDFIPRSIQTYLVLSYHVFVNWFVMLLPLAGGNSNLIILTILTFWLTGIVVVLFKRNELTVDVILTKLGKKRWFVISILPIINSIAGSVILYVVLTIVLFPMMGYLVGKNTAIDIKSKFQSCTLPVEKKLKSNHQCTYIYKNNELKVSGLYIAASEDYIAIYTGSKTIIYPLAGSIIKVVSPRNNSNSKH